MRTVCATSVHRLIAVEERTSWRVREAPETEVTPFGTATEGRRDSSSGYGCENRQQVSSELLLLAGIVGRVRVLDAKWSFAADLNDCTHFGERIMVGIRRQFDEAARTKLTGSLLIQLVAGPEVKFTGDNRYTFRMRMFVS